LQDSYKGIEHLNLYGNLIGDENTTKICDSLGKYMEHRLLSLNLGKNNISDKCSNVICTMAKSCSGLRSLNLSHNWLHNKPAAQIMNTLANNYELKVLDLSWNCIGDDLVEIPSYEELVNSEIKYPNKTFDNFTLEEALDSFKLKLRRNPLLPPLDEKSKKDKNDKNKQNQKAAEEPKEPKKAPVKPKKDQKSHKIYYIIYLYIIYNLTLFFMAKIETTSAINQIHGKTNGRDRGYFYMRNGKQF
jgi:Ran GTPase-activating protein (RanGAP) involved in mRNA processing and transport